MTPDHPYAGTLASLESLRIQWAVELEQATEPAHAAVLRLRLIELDEALYRLAACDHFHHQQEMQPEPTSDVPAR